MSQAAAIAIRLSLLLLLTGCHYAPAITPEDVQHHHWTLISINGVAVAHADNTNADLEIGEKMTINGNTGCRRFVGQGQLAANRLTITSLYLTGQRCPVEKEWIEKAILTTLKSEAALQMSDTQLVVRGEQYVLHYQLADWMH